VHVCERLNVIGVDRDGAFQSEMIVSERILHRAPSDADLRSIALTEPLAVACHDVRMGRLKKGDYCVVIGGGPIGLLTSLVAVHRGCDVLLLELNEKRAELARSMGVRTLDPNSRDVKALVSEETGGSGADVVFEVSASKGGAMSMTDIARPRGRIVLVGIFSEPTPAVLRQVFLKELEIIGARLYEAGDFDEAIGLIAGGSLDLAPLVSKIVPLERINEAFSELEGAAGAMKILVSCSD